MTKDQFVHLFQLFRKPKIVSLSILVLTIILIYFALALLSNTKREDQVSVPISQEIEPAPNSELNQNPSELTRKLSDFNRELENMTDFRQKLERPIVNLELGF